MDMRWVCAAWGFGLLAVATASPGQTVLQDLGALGADSRAFGVSADGQVVVGESGGQAFVWSAAGGIVALGGTRATGVSQHGEIICGYTGTGGASHRSVRWTAWNPASMQDLVTFGEGSFSAAAGVSADGAVIVGNAFNGDFIQPDTVAYRWTSAGGASLLAGVSPTFSGGPGYGALAVSADGSVVVGNRGVANPSAFRWSGTATSLVGAPQSSALGVSPDGTAVVGWYETGSGPIGFHWRAGSPAVLSDVPDLDGGAQNAAAYAVSADGVTVVGQGTGAGGPEAIIWDSAAGTRSLKVVLLAEGATEVGDWTLTAATAISPDGNVIVGYGTNPQGQVRAWRVKRGCYANCDGSLVEPLLNVADFTCFLRRFAAGDSYANCDNSTGQPLLTILDFTCYLTRYSDGCLSPG